MSTLIVGAGAVGGYLGSLLISAGCDVTFLVRPARLERRSTDGLRIRRSNGIDAVPAHAVTASGLRGPYDVVVLAVRSNMVASVIDDLTDHRTGHANRPRREWNSAPVAAHGCFRAGRGVGRYG
jgi:2-dehydropantoate 2-reductase